MRWLSAERVRPSRKVSRSACGRCCARAGRPRKGAVSNAIIQTVSSRGLSGPPPPQAGEGRGGWCSTYSRDGRDKRGHDRAETATSFALLTVRRGKRSNQIVKIQASAILLCSPSKVIRG